MPLPLHPPRIGPYEVKARLGRGGMGDVYLARHSVTGLIVAIKSAREVDSAQLASLRREIYALARLRHPGIVRLVDHGTSAGLPWCALEFVDGETMQTVLEPHLTGPTRASIGTPTTATVAASAPHGDGIPYLPVSDALRIVPPPPPYVVLRCLHAIKALCEPLSYLHGEGIVHCDLKPGNVVLRPDGTPVIIDFGLMVHFSGPHGRERLDESFAAVGTLDYMAPERIRRELVDARADLYAVGCMIFEILTGRPPFIGEPRAVMRQHLSGKPPRPSALAPNISPALDDLVLRLLQKDPRARLGYADSVAAALEAALPPRETPVPSVAPTSAGAPRAYLYRPSFTGHAAALRRITTEPGGMVLIGAESGAGKTRFAMEVGRLLAGEMRIVTGECLPVGPDDAPIFGAPLHPFGPLLRLIADECRSQGPGMSELLLGRRGRVLSDYEPALLELPEVLDLPTPARLTPEAAQQRLFADLAETLFAFAMLQRVVLIIDDLQWADELTLGFLRSFTSAGLADRGVLILGTYRKDEAPEALLKLAARPDVRNIALPRLDRDGVSSVARDMLALDPPPVALVDWLYSTTAGTPFFVAEHLRSAVELGLIARNAQGSWVAGRSLGSEDFSRLPTPGTVRSLLQTRLASLSEGARSWVFAAAVLGREVDREILERVARATFALGPDSESTPSRGRSRFISVEELLARQILQELPRGFRFVHDMFREVAYEQIPPEQRRLLHVSSAEAIEEIYTARGQLPVVYATLAHHYGVAEVHNKTIHYLDLAAEAALLSGAYEQSRTFITRLLELDKTRPALIPKTARARYHRIAGEASYALGDLHACGYHMALGLAEVGRPLPTSPLGWAERLGSGFARQAANFIAKRAPTSLFAPKTSPDFDRIAAAETSQMAAQLAFKYFFSGDAPALVATSLMAVNEAEAAFAGNIQGAPRGLSRPYAYLGYLTGLARLHPIARAYFRAAADTGKASGDPDGFAYALTTEAVYRMCLCDFRNAEKAAQEALAIQVANSNAMEAELLHTILGNIEYFTGRIQASRNRFLSLYESASRRRHELHRAWGLYAVAWCDLADGKADAALQRLREAESILVTHPDPTSELIVNGLFARAQAMRNQIDEAAIYADRVASHIDRPHMPTVFSTVHAYVALAEVRLRLWERSGNKTSVDALRAVAYLGAFAALFPLARPAALRCAAKAQFLMGAQRLAQNTIRSAIATAERLSMPIEEKLARNELLIMA
ncbi:MAG: protein kinase [Polyangiaceae bacterium]|nr:protein kinase [Polyangiaceae bacterium]